MTRVVVWDLETTGLNPYHDQIIEIAALDNFGNCFESLVSLEPGKTLSAKVKEITGINEEMLIGQPTIVNVLQQFLQFIEGADYMVGHNSVRFDSSFLCQTMRRHGFPPVTLKHLDTMLMCQYFYSHMYSYALATLCKYFRITQVNAHRAMGDVQATYKLFQIVSKDKGVSPDNLYTLL
jgi:DNA polymerase III epsilon subunit family exonuclease